MSLDYQTERALSEVKENLESYLLSKGINTNNNFKCFNANQHKNGDNSPSMGYDRKNNKVNCFACGCSYDLLDLIGLDYGLSSFTEKLERACEIYGVTWERTSYKEEPPKQGSNSKTASPEDIVKWASHYKETDYLRNRGISDKTANRFSIGYNTEFKTKNQAGEYATWKVITIPTENGSYVVRNTDKNAPGGDRLRKRGEALLFNASILETEEEPIFITEGEIDCLSIIELGFQAIGLGSVSNVDKFVMRVESLKGKIKAPLILALDNDEAGETASEILANKLRELEVLFQDISIYGSYKDANERLQEDREAFKEELEEAIIKAKKYKAYMREKYREEYREEYIASKSALCGLRNFINNLQNANTPAIRTHFNTLDEVLEGGLYEGLYIFGAVPSLGKTDLVLNMADRIASYCNGPQATEEEQNTSIIYISLEMAQSELIARSISKYTFLGCKGRENEAKTIRGITDFKRYANYSPSERELIKQAFRTYENHAKRIFFYEGVGNISAKEIGEIIREHIEETGYKPIVIVDYLQIMAPWIDEEHPNRALTEKQSTDKNVLELKRLSREHKLPIIAISSFNRESYTSKSDLMSAFKESGAIEYGADLLGGLVYKTMFNSNGKLNKDFDVNEERSRDPREIALYILKNRNGKIPRNPICFLYKSKFHYFEENELENA